MNTLRLTILYLFFISFFIATAQVKTNIPLPEDVVTGTLKNGMTYFIKHNEEPKGRASFYFSQRVGSVLEKEDQSGLAHFLEHMAFNGSVNFPNRSLIQMLESKGLVFGKNFNAYTDFDETVYNIDNVPTDDMELINNCLLVLRDWSGNLLLKDEDIEKERGVIYEEWRSRRTPRGLVQEKFFPLLLRGSKYENRQPIGDFELLKSFDYDRLKEFYNTWYRPDLQAVVVVGDFDVRDMEKKVKELFSKIPTKKNAVERTYGGIPDYEGFVFEKIFQKGIDATGIDWFFKEGNVEVKDKNYLAKELVHYLFSDMLAARLDELTQNPDVALASAYVGSTLLGINKKASVLGIYPRKNKILQAYEETFIELQRIRLHGFDKSEFERQKQIMLKNYKNSVIDEKFKNNSQWASNLSKYYTKGDVVQTASWYYDFTKEALMNITLEEVNEVADRLFDLDNSQLILTAPESEAAEIPEKETFLKVFNKVAKLDVAPYENTMNDAPLIAKELVEAKVEKELKIPSIPEVKGVLLENGAQVYFLPSVKKTNTVELNGFSWGGYSQVPLKDLNSAKMATNLVNLSGLGEFDASELRKKLSVSTANLSTGISNYQEDVSGSATLEDMETLLQLCYLRFAAPRFNKEQFDAEIEVQKQQLKFLRENPDYVFMDSIQKAIYGTNPRRKVFLDKEDLDQLDFEKSKETYKNRFKGADDFTFILTGDYDQENALKLVKKYIGNIKKSNVQETWIDHGVRKRKGLVENTFKRKMEDNPQTNVFYQISGKIEKNLKNELSLRVIESILSSLYLDSIREEEGGSYGVGVSAQLFDLPENSFDFMVRFKCNPEKSKELVAIVKEKIENLKTEIPVDYLNKSKENLLKDRDEAKLENGYLYAQLFQKLYYDKEPVTDKEYHEVLKAINAKTLKEFIKTYFENGNVFEVVMNPL